uniref:Uncharacterized protein n=1 Tax=Amphiprion percula TaxID=161767 RepID=A0A3P8T4U9_AMPPE
MLVTSIFTVPDLCGVPPSTAMSFKEKCGCRSLSKGFCSTISTYLLPTKCSFRDILVIIVYN